MLGDRVGSAGWAGAGSLALKITSPETGSMDPNQAVIIEIVLI